MQQQTEKPNNVSEWAPDRWALNISVLIISGAATYKVSITPFNLELDLNALLSLLLALFSVALSALFYFKANEASNAFYDNTYKFTKDIAELLVRIESGFGERLRHLDEGYTSMRDHITNSYPNGNVGEAKKDLQAEEDEVKEKENERNKLLEELLKQTQMDAEEKEKIRKQLTENENGLMIARHEAAVLKGQLAELISAKNDSKDDGARPNLISQRAKVFLRDDVMEKMGGYDAVATMPSSEFRSKFSELYDDLPTEFIQDLRDAGIEFSNGRIGITSTIRLRNIMRNKSR